MNTDQPFDGLHADLSARVIACFFAVHNELGSGFLESIYRKALLISLREAGMNCDEEYGIPVSFHGQRIGNFSADINVEGKLILELKIDNQITREAEGQLLHYLRATPVEVGYVLAFGDRGRFRRMLFTNDRKRLAPPSSAPR